MLSPKIISGIPAGTKAAPRADFKPTEYDQAIATKGYRMFWSRAGICPCVNNDQTDQPDPLCRLCGGDAYYYFLPDPAIEQGSAVDSQGNPITLNRGGDGVMIYVLMTSLTQDVQVFEKFGEWVFGTARATTQSPNKLGYRDRLVSIDSEMTWAQVVEYGGGDEIIVTGERSKAGLRYPFVTVNQLRSTTAVYRENTDFELTDSGTIRWLVSGVRPAANTRLSVHGAIRPVWIVMDHVNTYRDTMIQGGSSKIRDQIHKKLPVQAVVKLDFLINE